MAKKTHTPEKELVISIVNLSVVTHLHPRSTVTMKAFVVNSHAKL